MNNDLYAGMLWAMGAYAALIFYCGGAAIGLLFFLDYIGVRFI